MNAEKSLKLARRFIELPLEKRRLFLDSLRAENIDFSLFPIPAGVAVEDRQELSYAQRRMWLLWQLDPQSGAYNLPGAVRLTGALNRQALEQAFAALVARHETLRTVFKQQADDRLEQAPATESLSVAFLDLSSIDATAREQAVAAEAQRQSLLPFDLDRGPLLRVKLLQLDAQEHVLLLTLHHIVSDGWSMNVLIDEFIRCYDAFERGEAPQLPPLPIQYSDYALWQRRWLEAGEQARQLEYWQAQLGDEHPVLELPLDHPRPAMPSYRGTRYEFAVAPELAEQLRTLARQHNVTLFMLLLGAFDVLLHRYTGQDDIRVGVPIANRNRAEVEGLIGFFVNTQVLRTQLTGQTRVSELLQVVKEAALGAQAHQDLPFEQLVEALKLERNLSHTPLFQVMYNHQPQVADISTVRTASGLELGLVQWQSRTTQFDLTLDTYEKSGTLHAALTYAEDLFDAGTIARMARHWTALLQGMLEDAEQRIGELPMLDGQERQTLVHDWNATAQAYPTGLSMPQLIAAQVRRTPEACALVFGEQQLSYAELDARANRLARLLREQGVAADVLVGICIERSIEMVVGLLAIHKAGGAYVPLDPEYPRDRLAYMIEDSGIRLLLSQRSLLPLLDFQAAAEAPEVILLDQDQGALLAYDSGPLETLVDPLNLAYVIYTSGSTGKPKGAGNSHAALVNRLFWMQQAYGLDASDAVLQKTPFSFDVSVWEFFWPLMTGARLVVAAPGAHREPARLIDTIIDHGISTLHFVPSMLQAFIHEQGVSACTGLKRIVCSGEALPLEAQQQVFARLPGAGLYNLYGPTEAAIDVTHWICVDEGASSVPIGQPIANLRTHVLDAQLLPVPAGVAGELYLGGAGLARSYHRRPALTAERFVPCPFQAGARLYRTGDRVRQRADGVIEYLGRLDHQVKLRGLRIELGEIEARLMEHPQVREATVLVVDGKQLVAYLVLQEAAADWREELMAYLGRSLPEYMVPAQWVPQESMPLTPNGKLDRKALLSYAGEVLLAPYSAPREGVEQTLAQIWGALLAVEQVGLDDNFFALGGDSIISIQVVSRARLAGLLLSPRDLFQHQTLRSLAQAAKPVAAGPVDSGPVQGAVALTPVQHWFMEQAVPQRQHWNQSLLLQARQPLEAERLSQALTRLVTHHDALRLRVRKGAEGWQQAYAIDAGELLWQRSAATAEQLTELCEAAQRSLDLEQGPLLRAMLVNLADGSQRLLLVIHHWAVDGVSWRVLLEDLQQLYTQPELALAPRSSSYQAWSAHLQQAALARSAELDYWQAQIPQQLAELPVDHPGAALEHRHEQKITLTLGVQRTAQLLQQATAAYRTQINDLLLTALARTLGHWTGAEGSLVQLEGHGRESLGSELDLGRSVGWFTSLFPVYLRGGGEPGAALKAIKEQLRGVPDKGLGFGLLRYLGDDASRAAMAQLAQPRVTFNYLGQFDRQFDAQALLLPASEKAGQSQDPHAPLANWLVIEGQVYGGELSLNWGFSREMYEPATIQGLVDLYREELEGLIEHCLDPRQGAFTPSDVSLARLTQAQLDDLALPAREVQDLYPLSPMQQGMLFHSLYQQGQDDVYVSQLRADVQGLDVVRFQAAWEQVLARHDMLRTGFVWQDDQGQALQVVYRQAHLPFIQYDWRERPDQAAALDALALEQHQRGFELARPPLLRVVLVRTAEDRWHLLYTSHHILMDGWSNALVLNEVLQLCKGQPLPPVGAGFSRHIAWLQQQDPAQGEAFWRQRLAQLDEPCHLARSVVKAALPAPGEYGELLCELDEAQTARLNSFARAQQVTLNTLVQSAWLLLLQRYTGQSSVACGVTVSGRPADLADVEQQVGLFINTLPLIATAHPARSVADWVREVQALNLEMREHEHTPLFDIQRWAGSAGEALFDTLVVFENFPVAKSLEQSAQHGLRFSAVQSQERTNYPLTLTAHGGQRLSLHLEYFQAEFSPQVVQGLAAYLQALLQRFVEAPEQAVGAVPLLLQDQQQQLLLDWNPAEVWQPAQACVLQRFEHQAALHPDNLALILDRQRLSYAELNLRANRLAHHLIELGVDADTLVGVAVGRSLEMIVALLAVLKAGGAYVPLDPQYPSERLQCMIEDSGLQLLLTQQALLEQLPLDGDLPRVCLEADPQWLAHYSGLNPAPRAQPGNLAYVMFTSGSTGRPKGVGIDRASLARHVEVIIKLFELKADDRALQFGTFNFDGFVEQLYPALCCGAGVVVRGGELWDSDTFYQQLIEHQISVVDVTTAYWYLLVRDFAERGPRDYGRLRQLHIGGEAMPPEGLKAWRDAGLGHVRLFNTYGPTETTVSATALDCAGYVDGREPLPATMPIGRVLDGRAIYLLDANLNPLPAGVTGELLIGGPLLARGYFQRPELTAERFIPDPFTPGGAGRLYRTGDLARYRADGVIEYVGRIDHQVKVRGFRIELGEIEARLLAQASVREALVIAADNQLLGYVVASQALAEAGQGPLREQLKAGLRAELPDYMVPAHILFLDHLPLSPNGKLDRAALPKPDTSQTQADWKAPVSELEQQVATIWSQVLGIERIGLDEHFFELGGHSLLATQMVSRVRHGLGVEVSLRTLFEQPQLENFVRSLGHPAVSSPAILPLQPGQPLPLSYAQERQWFLWQLDPQSAAYHVPSVLRLKGRLERAALQRAFDSLVARHASLRTHLQQDGQRTVQVIEPEARIELALADADEAALKAWVEAEIARPFDLRQGPLMRVSLLRLAADEHVLVLVQHHIVSDGWSMQLMVDELVQLYAAYSQGQELQLPALPIQYADYALWQRNWMEAGEKDRQLGYWRELLGGEQPVLELPLDHPRPALPSHRGARLNVPLPAALLAGLKGLAQRQGVTLFMLLLASYQILLHRYSGQQDIRVGVPIANRNRVETERLIGFFVNTQVMKADIDGQLTVSQLLAQVKQRALEAQAHQDLPFEQLVEALQPERSLSLSPLFQVMFNHHISLAGNHLQRLAHLDMSPLSWDEGVAQFDLTLDIEESQDQVRASLSYATDLFEPATIGRMARHWQNLLQAMVADPQQSIGQLNLLDDSERQQLLQLWDRSASGFPAGRLVHELVADRARENPEAVAVIFDTQTLTYGELDRSANRLARALIARGVGPEVRVAIAMPRSAEIMVAFLAVLKAGGVYVPLDVEYPEDRLLYMLQDSRAQLLLTHSAVADRLPIPQGLLSLAVDRTGDWAGADDTAPQVALDGDNLAYVIYTSGSTGMPKGVAVSHGPLVAHIIATGERYEMTAADCELHFMSFAFDGSHEGWMHPLINGARVLIRDDSLWLPEQTYAEMHRHGVTVGVFPPVYLQQLAEHAERDGNPPAVRVYCFGGDAVAQASYDLAWRALRPTYLFNGYGPTETVVTPLLWKARQGDACGAVYMPIGTLLGNRSGYVLDAQLNLQPIGVAGELYLGGEGVARGYLERPALTAERFVPDPFGTAGGRLYRSGDLTRGRADGVVDYLGRVDHQVKIRGFRIELGEIEARLREQEAVREAVVVAQDGPTGKQLVAYIVPLQPDLLGDALAQAECREALRRALRVRLPDYMLPAHFMFLQRMPLTPNGKLDRKGLPQPDAGAGQQVYVAAQTELEQQVAAVWAEVLGVERVGLNDHFFELGGHSLLAMQVISRLRQLLDQEVALRTLFEQPQLQGFVAGLQACEDSTASQVPAMLPVSRQQPLALSYAQERQWFLWQLDPHSAAYHIPSILRLRGLLDLPALQRSFDALVARHESLRTLVYQDGERALQLIQPALALPIVRADTDQAGLQALVEAEIARPFDLQQGPLLRVSLLRLAEDEHVLVLVQHHIVSDGWSMQVMVDELVQLYAAYSQGQDLQLPAMVLQYADYAVWQRSWMEAGEKERQLGYWREQLGGEQPVLELPCAHPRPALPSYRGASLEVELQASLAQGLKHLAQAEGVTLFMLLLASFQTLLHRYSGQQDIRVGVPIANRNRVEIERLIGFFVNTQVMKADIDGLMPFSQLLQQVRQRALDAQSHQDLPFEQLVEALQPERNLSHNPLFQVMFNHQSDARLGHIEQPSLALQVEGLDWGSQTAQFDLSLDTRETADGIHATLTYATDLFEPQMLKGMMGHWQNLLQALLTDPRQRVGQLPVLDEQERLLMVEQWNDTTRDYPLQRNVQQLIEEQVARTPDAPALKFGSLSLSYAELNRRANRLAHRLMEVGVGPDVLVGLAVERSIEMVVGLLAVLKAGGAYVPLDPEYPRERLAYMLDDSGVKLLLTQSHLLEQLPIPQGLQTLELDQLDAQLTSYSEQNPGIVLQGENLAYVIYTSGSTGQPKGAGNRHSALTNRLCWMQEAYQLDASDSVLQKTPFSFDVSVWEFFWPLMTGARLVVAAPGDHRDPEKLVNLINAEQISTLHFVPSMLQAFLQDSGVSSCQSLKRIVCSGEALPVDAQQQVFAKLPQAGLYNLYGPTEAAIDVTHWTCVDEGRDAVPIGQPIANLQTHVLDEQLQLVAAGVMGELYLGGVGLARGYHRRPGLSAERFVPCPFQPGARLYRTGDRVRQRADGVIEYLGRFDHQVKLRGLRIELGEIEARLLEYPQVREATVQVVDGKHLVGYLVLQERAEHWREALGKHLLAHLPDYMVPAQWVLLQQMPLSPNGKLDRKALPKPDASQHERRYVAPQSELELRVAGIWSEILEVERVGLNDNFFELGGHSLLVLMLKERIRKATGTVLSVSQLMLNPTVAGQVACLEGEARSSLIVKLNSQTQGTPLFLFHPSYGSVHCYKAIALALREQCPVMGVMCRALAEPGSEVPAWQAMVEDYAAQLLDAQPQGAYRLAGWSLGGNLAMEVAHVLEQAGREVEFLGWIDASPPYWLKAYWDTAVIADSDEIPVNWRRVELLQVMFAAASPQIRQAWEQVQASDVSEDEQWQAFDAWAEQALGDAYMEIKGELLQGNEAEISWELDRALGRRLRDADFKRIKAPVSCWWAAASRAGQHRQLIEASIEQCMGQPCIRQSQLIDSTHERIIDNPAFVQSFVAAIK